jgi:hypothetical protein
MSDSLSDLEKKILSVILSDSHRPSAITRIIRSKNPEYDQNQVVASLNELEKRDLVERFTSKTWIAKSKAADLLE